MVKTARPNVPTGAKLWAAPHQHPQKGFASSFRLWFYSSWVPADEPVRPNEVMADFSVELLGPFGVFVESKPAWGFVTSCWLWLCSANIGSPKNTSVHLCLLSACVF